MKSDNNVYIIRPKELSRRLQVSKPTIWRMEKEGRLPERKKIAGRAVGWLSTDIQAWFDALPSASSEKEEY